MPRPRQFASMTKGKQLLFIQTEQMDKVGSGANRNEALSNLCSATTKAMQKIGAEEKALLDTSLKYVCDVEVSGDLVKFNVLVPLSMKYQVEGMPRSYRVYPVTMPLTKGFLHDMKDQLSDPDYNQPLYIKKIKSEQPIPFLLDECIASYRQDLEKKSAIDSNKAKMEVKAQKNKEAAKSHSQTTNDDEEAFLLSDFVDMKEEQKSAQRSKSNKLSDMFHSKKGSAKTNAPVDTKLPEPPPVAELTELQKLKNNIIELEKQLVKLQSFKAEHEEIQANIDFIKENIKTHNQIDNEQFYLKQAALLQCIQEKINYAAMQNEMLGIQHEIDSAITQNESLERKIEQTTTGGKSSEAPIDQGVLKETKLETPFDAISRTMSEIDAITSPSPENVDANLKSMQNELNQLPQNLRTSALSHLKRNEYLVQKLDALASPEHMQLLQFHMCNKLYNSLLDQLDAWSQHPPRLGVSVRHNGKNIMVPEGMGKMLILLNPEAHKPQRLNSIFRKKSTGVPLTRSGRPALTIEPDESLKILSQCRAIAQHRLEKSSLDKRLDALDHTENLRQDNNLQILVATSHLKISAIKDPQQISSIMNEYDKKLGKLAPLSSKTEAEKTAKTEYSPKQKGR